MIFQLVEIKDELPLLTEIAIDSAADDLPLLTEIVAAQAGESARTRTLDGDEMVKLLQRLEFHLETVFTEKLNNQLEQLQRLAVDLAVSEFKAELPQLLHDALIKADENRN
jgi:hypothetical protein